MRVSALGRALRPCRCAQFNKKRAVHYPFSALVQQMRLLSVSPISRQVDGETMADRPPAREPFPRPIRGQLDGERRLSRPKTGGLPPGVRIVPASPSYFSGRPVFYDSLIELRALLRKYEHLPLADTSLVQSLQSYWLTFDTYRSVVGEPVKKSRYERMLGLIRRLNKIHPLLMPEEVKEALAKFRRDSAAQHTMGKKRGLDMMGRAYGAGRRKTSSARVWLVEGDGDVLINGKALPDVFGRVHDRESALWPLKATERVGKYNVWAIVSGGGTTGQAEALTLALARALMVHEPELKPLLRRAGCVTRDPRAVERKKPGKLKARKMPAWVKR